MKNPFKVATGAIVAVEGFAAFCWSATLKVQWLSFSLFVTAFVVFIFGLVWFISGVKEYM